MYFEKYLNEFNLQRSPKIFHILFVLCHNIVTVLFLLSVILILSVIMLSGIKLLISLSKHNATQHYDMQHNTT